MAKTLKRIFYLQDDRMLERARMFHDALEGELASFTARFPWMDSAWLAAFRDQIDVADAIPKDDSVMLDLKVLTGDVQQAMRESLAALQALDGYAALAWPNEKARQRAFGQDGWRAARYDCLKMQEALELAHDMANDGEYRPALLAKGYRQEDIDALATMAEQLQQKNRLQESARTGRPVASQDRVETLNAVWRLMQTVNTCAAIVWATDTERRGRYSMYPKKSKKKAEPEGGEEPASTDNG